MRAHLVGHLNACRPTSTSLSKPCCDSQPTHLPLRSFAKPDATPH
ncbi:hypothetical protein ACFPRL_36480 [Pseudoclavibacter helvolus]